jgi:hypothetical protein
MQTKVSSSATAVSTRHAREIADDRRRRRILLGLATGGTLVALLLIRLFQVSA